MSISSHNDFGAAAVASGVRVRTQVRAGYVEPPCPSACIICTCDWLCWLGLRPGPYCECDWGCAVFNVGGDVPVEG